MSALPLRARIGGRVRRLGWRATLAKFFADHVYRRSSSVMLEYHRGWQQRASEFAPPPGLTFVAVEPGEPLPALCPWLAHRGPAFARMLAAGKSGVFVCAGDVAIGCAWIAYADHRDAQAREFYAVAPGEAYLYCWLLDPAHRRSQAGLALARFTYAMLERRGIDRQFVIVDRVNRSSFTIQRRFGFRECGIEVIHLYLLHTRWTWQRRYTGELGLLPHAARA